MTTARVAAQSRYREHQLLADGTNPGRWRIESSPCRPIRTLSQPRRSTRALRSRTVHLREAGGSDRVGTAAAATVDVPVPEYSQQQRSRLHLCKASQPASQASDCSQDPPRQRAETMNRIETAASSASNSFLPLENYFSELRSAANERGPASLKLHGQLPSDSVPSTADRKHIDTAIASGSRPADNRQRTNPSVLLSSSSSQDANATSIAKRHDRAPSESTNCTTTVPPSDTVGDSRSERQHRTRTYDVDEQQPVISRSRSLTRPDTVATASRPKFRGKRNGTVCRPRAGRSRSLTADSNAAPESQRMRSHSSSAETEAAPSTAMNRGRDGRSSGTPTARNRASLRGNSSSSNNNNNNNDARRVRRPVAPVSGNVTTKLRSLPPPKAAPRPSPPTPPVVDPEDTTAHPIDPTVSGSKVKTSTNQDKITSPANAPADKQDPTTGPDGTRTPTARRSKNAKSPGRRSVPSSFRRRRRTASSTFKNTKPQRSISASVSLMTTTVSSSSSANRSPPTLPTANTITSEALTCFQIDFERPGEVKEMTNEGYETGRHSIDDLEAFVGADAAANERDNAGTKDGSRAGRRTNGRKQYRSRSKPHSSKPSRRSNKATSATSSRRSEGTNGGGSHRSSERVAYNDKSRNPSRNVSTKGRGDTATATGASATKIISQTATHDQTSATSVMTDIHWVRSNHSTRAQHNRRSLSIGTASLDDEQGAGEESFRPDSRLQPDVRNQKNAAATALSSTPEASSQGVQKRRSRTPKELTKKLFGSSFNDIKHFLTPHSRNRKKGLNDMLIHEHTPPNDRLTVASKLRLPQLMQTDDGSSGRQ